MYPILWNQVNVTDIANKSSGSFFVIITTVARENSGVVSRIIYMTCKSKHRSTTALEEILLELRHHIAGLAWLIQEYLFLVKK